MFVPHFNRELGGYDLSMHPMWLATLGLACVIGSGLIAGVFYAFSTFIMNGLARRPAAEAVAAMQAINVTVLTTWFLGIFIGQALLSLVAIIVGALQWNEPFAPFFIAGGGLYFFGTFLVTGMGNVPLNNTLAQADPNDADEIWTHYLKRWTMLNHIRTVAATLAMGAFTLGLWW